MAEVPENQFTPKTTPFLVGHEKAAGIFLKAFNANRLHHAWLLAGPRGIGKATLAYHLTRFLLKHGNQEGGLLGGDAPTKFSLDDLNMSPDDPIFTRVASGGEGNVKVIKRGFNIKTLKKRTEIVVDDVRALHDFFEMTASHPGWRIAIIDTADEMNRSAANALLKMLEEPPARSLLFLITHAKGRLVPTIKSRCQQLILNSLPDADVEDVIKRLLPDMPADDVGKFTAAAGGSPGLALRLSLFDGAGLFGVMRKAFTAGGLGTKDAYAFADQMGLAKNEDQYFLFLEILSGEIARKIKTLSLENSPKSQLDCWLDLWDKVVRIKTEGEGINLSRKSMLIILLEQMAAVSRLDNKAA